MRDQVFFYCIGMPVLTKEVVIESTSGHTYSIPAGQEIKVEIVVAHWTGEMLYEVDTFIDENTNKDEGQNHGMLDTKLLQELLKYMQTENIGTESQRNDVQRMIDHDEADAIEYRLW